MRSSGWAVSFFRSGVPGKVPRTFSPEDGVFHPARQCVHLREATWSRVPAIFSTGVPGSHASPVVPGQPLWPALAISYYDTLAGIPPPNTPQMRVDVDYVPPRGALRLSMYPQRWLSNKYWGWPVLPATLEPAVGIEPTTGGLRNRCSTSELRWHSESDRIIPESQPDEQRFTPRPQSCASTTTEQRFSPREAVDSCLLSCKVNEESGSTATLLSLVIYTWELAAT